MLEETIDDPFPVPPEQPPEVVPDEAGPSEADVPSYTVYEPKSPRFPEPLLHTAVDLTLRISVIELWRMIMGEAPSLSHLLVIMPLLA